MHLPRFRHLRPTTTKEALRILKEYGPQAKLVAGGTDLFPRMKYGLACPDVVVSLKNIPVTPPTWASNGDLNLDAMMTLADVARSPCVRERAPLLIEASLSVGSNQIRHMGTLGGNLCLENRCFYYNQTHTFQFADPCFKRGGDQCYLIPKGKKCCAVFSGDTAPALISLGTELIITDSESDRQMPLENLYTGDALKPLAISDTEIITGIIIPEQDSPQGNAFFKFSRRGGMEFAAVTVAVALFMEDDDITCHEVRIVAGAISTGPVRMIEAEDAIRGQLISTNIFEQAAQIAGFEARLFPHHGYSVVYLRECLRVQTLRALTLASKQLRT
ncbi:MAG: FAD binding domain-containing protein [Thermodesulfobacteriota bacterium]|nr:FAD binding domain-containing protein [Thermodesulfobacteriota bacterium]